MKKVNIILPISILLIAFMAVSCQKDEKSSVGFSLKTSDTNEPAPTSEEPVFGTSNDVPLMLEWNAGWIYITEIEFTADFISPSVSEGNKEPGIHLEWSGNQKVDLFSDPRIFANLEIPDGMYENIAVELTSARINDMQGPNFYLSGIYGPLFGGTPISLAVSQPFSMVMKHEGAIMNTEDHPFFEALVELSLDNLFSGITASDLDKAELTDGWILISATQNQDLYEMILKNLGGIFGNDITWGFHLSP